MIHRFLAALDADELEQWRRVGVRLARET